MLQKQSHKGLRSLSLRLHFESCPKGLAVDRFFPTCAFNFVELILTHLLVK